MTNADFESVKQLSYVATSDKTALGVEFGTGRVFGWGFNAKGLLGVDMSQVHAPSRRQKSGASGQTRKCQQSCSE